MSSRAIFFPDRQYPFQNCHPHGDSVLHLIQNHRPLRIGHLARKLAPANDGPGMHHDDIRLRQRHNPSRALLRRTDARHVIAPSSARLSPPDAAAILPTMTDWSVIIGGALVALAIIVMLTLLLHGAPSLG